MKYGGYTGKGKETDRQGSWAGTRPSAEGLRPNEMKIQAEIKLDA